MKIIRKITIHLKEYQIKRIYFCNIPILEYKKFQTQKKIKKSYNFFIKQKPKQGQRIFYLKVHRETSTSYACIQQWIDLAHQMNAFVYFVCDNSEFKYNIYSYIRFYDNNFDFIKSDRKTLKKELNIILNNTIDSKRWRRVAFAMFTSFTDAAKNNYNITYNIDADDILIFAPDNILSKAFIKAEEYALKNKLDLFNLDMFVSRTYGVHWSFGVVICTNPHKCLSAIKSNTDWKETQKYVNQVNLNYIKKYNWNADWYFTYLRDTKQLNVKTFYIENAFISHEPDRLIFPGWSYIMQWKNNNIFYLFAPKIYENHHKSIIPIFTECVKIDVGLSDNDYIKFVKKFIDQGYKTNEQDMYSFAIERKKKDTQQCY